ncbi:MAG: HEAT repeat domain-containing protein [Gemmatimonadota bacterium]|nr:HEAT repeat domain-containing protein [Gemmatimonadota bacterium]
MQVPSISDSLLDKQALWHATSRENADAIRKEGFHPARKSGQHRHRQATWFYHVTPIRRRRAEGPDVGVVLAVDLDMYERGRDYIHEMEDTVVFKVPLPPECLIAQLNWPEIKDAAALATALDRHWHGDVISELETCCYENGIPWSRKRSISEMLWSLAPRRYLDSDVLCQMLVAEVSGLSLEDARQHAMLFREHCPRFLEAMLHLYHRTFLTPRLARAMMLAAARHLPPVEVLKLAEGTHASNSQSREAKEIATFARSVLPVIPRDELVRGAIEMASMRYFPGTDDDIQEIGDWVAKWADEAQDVAFHYIRFAGDSYPARHKARVARSLAVRILSMTGGDHFDRLIALGDTDDLEALSGVTHAFAGLREPRGVPFLASRLKDPRKGPRAEAALALGKIGTSDALAAVRSIANDKRRIVRNAVQQALRMEGH